MNTTDEEEKWEEPDFGGIITPVQYPIRFACSRVPRVCDSYNADLWNKNYENTLDEIDRELVNWGTPDPGDPPGADIIGMGGNAFCTWKEKVNEKQETEGIEYFAFKGKEAKMFELGANTPQAQQITRKKYIVIRGEKVHYPYATADSYFEPVFWGMVFFGLVPGAMYRYYWTEFCTKYTCKRIDSRDKKEKTEDEEEQIYIRSIPTKSIFAELHVEEFRAKNRWHYLWCAGPEDLELAMYNKGAVQSLSQVMEKYSDTFSNVLKPWPSGKIKGIESIVDPVDEHVRWVAYGGMSVATAVGNTLGAISPSPFESIDDVPSDEPTVYTNYLKSQLEFATILTPTGWSYSGRNQKIRVN